MAKEIQAYYNGALTLYAIIRRKSDGYVWNGSAWAAWVNGSVASYAITLSGLGGDFYAVDWPTAMPGGVDCRVIVYARTGATPAITDVIVSSTERYWNGYAAGTSSTITIDPYALTSLDNFKVYMRISGSDYDSPLTQAINAATALIQAATGRNFLARDYKERHDGIWQRQLVLFHFPAKIQRITYGRAVAFNVRYTGSAIRATVSANTDGMRLQSISTGGAITSTTLLYADYPSLSVLLAALPAGWTYNLQNNRPSYEITPSAGESAKDRDVIFYYPDSDTIEYTVDEAWGRVQMSKLGNIWFQDQTVYPATFPNYSPKYRGRPIVNEFQGLLVEYRGGYETIPADVENVCHQMAQRIYHRGTRDPEMRASGMGPFSVTFSSGDEATYIRSLLAQYVDARAYMA